MVETPPAGNVVDLIGKKYGVKITAFENPLITQAGLAALKLLTNNPRRVGVVLINLSVNNMYLGLSPGVSAANGIFIAPGGGAVSMDLDSDFTLPSMEWWVIAAGAASPLYCLSVEIYD